MSTADLLAKVEAMRDKAKAREAEQAKAREERAEQNRRLMPKVAAFIDDMRAAFGDQIKVVFASDNGYTIGKPDTNTGVKLSETVVGPWNPPGDPKQSNRRKRR